MIPQHILWLCIGIYILGMFGVYYYFEKTEPDKEGDDDNIFMAMFWPLMLILLIIAFPFELLSKLAKK